MYWDHSDGQGCRAESGGFKKYDEGAQVIMGLQPAVTGVVDTRIACLVKYQMHNANTIHDLRINLYNMQPLSATYLAAVTLGALSGLVALL